MTRSTTYSGINEFMTSLQKKRVANYQNIPNTNTFSTVLHITTSKETVRMENKLKGENFNLQ